MKFLYSEPLASKSASIENAMVTGQLDGQQALELLDEYPEVNVEQDYPVESSLE